MPRFTNTLLTIAIALLLCACAMQSNQQSAMEAELQENMQLAQILCYEHNNTEACFRFGGVLFEDGINARDDSERTALINKGQKYLLKSCDLNHGDGCAFYATTILFNSLSDVMTDNKQLDFKATMNKINKDDLATYMQYIKKSCELDSSMGCEELGDSYWSGDGVKKDEKLSFFYRKKSCDLAQTPKDTLLSKTGLLGGTNCIKVGRMYYNGEGVAKNKKLALEYFIKGCSVLGSHCGDYVQYFYDGYNGENIKVPQDYEFAFKLAQKGCKTNNNESCNYLGILYEEGKGTTKDFKKAFWTFYELCYEKPDSRIPIPEESGSYVYIPDNSDYKKTGCYNLAICYANGQGTEQNYKRAFGMFQKLCDEDEMGGACGMVGEFYFNAKGIRQDYRSALYYFGKACDMGEQSGCDNHKMMKRNPYAYGLSESDF